MDVAAPIWLCAGDPAAADDVARPLEAAGHVVRRLPLADTPAPTERPTLVVLDGRPGDEPALQFCRRLRARSGDGPVLFVPGDTSPAARLACLDAGADAYLLRPFAPRELLARTDMLLRAHHLQRRLTEKAAEAQQTCQRLRQAYRQIDQDLAAVRQMQRHFLPRALPDVPGVTLAAHYHPCGQVGGDSFDAFRLDEHHVGFYVADALGHGTPAALLTMFLKQTIRGKDVQTDGYRLVPPDEVLRRLNRDLIEQALADVPFVTMLYAIYDCRDRVLRFARAGHPHPIYLPREGNPEIWTGPGNLLGVFATDFTAQTKPLRPGDKVLLQTDGLAPPDAAPLLECAARHRDLPIRQCVERMACDLLAGTNPLDDFTLLGLEVASS